MALILSPALDFQDGLFLSLSQMISILFGYVLNYVMLWTNNPIGVETSSPSRV